MTTTVFNQTGFARWQTERVAASQTAHQAREAHTLIEAPRRSERGDMVLTDARYWETRIARNGRGGQLLPVAGALKAEAGSTGLGDAAPMVLAYSVDKERGIPNPEGIRVQEMDVSSTITADGDPTERTDRGMRIVAPRAICEGAHGVTEMDTTTALQGSGGKPGQGYQAVRSVGQVRRLTPSECERLQGFPDGWTIVDKQAVAAMKARWS